MTRIGNTAEYGTSGLDEGQALGLLSAVSGRRLPLVEPGPMPDPVVAGLNTAINRAYHAWVKSQPQLILDLWPDGLDEPQLSHSLLRLVEPVPNPCGLTAAPSGGGFDLTQGPCRISPEESRGAGQEGD